MESLLYTGGGLAFVFFMTCLGAASVFFFKKPITVKFRQIFLGFAAGIMIAASIWGLLIPSLEESKESSLPDWLPVILGFVLGIGFLLGLDRIIPHFHQSSNLQEGRSSSSKRSTLLLSAVLLHNIPEGIAVGLAFALVSQQDGSAAMYASAIALALGIGIHNLPESATISLLFRHEGMPALKSFLLGCLAGAVDLAFAVITIFLASWLIPAMPWLLSFAAGAMMYVVVEELIPEANLGKHSHAGTLSVMAGFLLMILLEVVI